MWIFGTGAGAVASGSARKCAIIRRTTAGLRRSAEIRATASAVLARVFTARVTRSRRQPLARGDVWASTSISCPDVSSRGWSTIRAPGRATRASSVTKLALPVRRSSELST